MTINYKTVYGSQSEKPEEVDLTSSFSTVYLRKNIEQVEQKNQDGETVKLWKYDEAALTKEEYEEYQAELNSPAQQATQEQLGALADGLDNNTTNVMTIMGAIADLYDVIATLG